MVDDAGSEADFYRSLVELSIEPDADKVLSRALSLLVGVTDAREAYIEIHAPEQPESARWWRADGCSAERIEAIRARVSSGIVAAALESGGPLVTHDASRDPRFRDLESVRDHAIEAVVCQRIGSAPILGVVYVQGRRSPTDEPEFDGEAIDRIGIFSRAVAPVAELLVRREMERRRLLASRDAFGEVVHASPKMRDLVRQLAFVAARDVRVLLAGPSGAGKTLLASAIHAASHRADGPFVELNCAAIPESLVENELFGHVAGAYSSASREGKKGHVEAADGGTLFLDEVAELSLASQAKLLHFLDSGSFRRLGSTTPKRADVRVLSATNVDLEKAVAAGRFREDLMFRLRAFVARVPPLSERPEDVVPLAREFCRRHAREMKLEVRGLGPSAIHALRSAEWRGNVRELENIVRNGVLMAGARDADVVDAADLVSSSGDERAALSQTLHDATERFQRAHIHAALEARNWVVSDAARDLNVARSYLYTRMNALGLRRA